MVFLSRGLTMCRGDSIIQGPDRALRGEIAGRQTTFG